MASIHNIAKACNVSSATVSRVLNGSANVSQRTRELILRKMHEMRYKPTVSKNTSCAVAVTFVESQLNAGPYEAGLLRHLLLALDESETPVRIISAPRLQSINPANLSAIISMSYGSGEEKWLRRLEGTVPIIGINSGTQYEGMTRVESDHAQGSRLAVAYLHRMGHRRVAYLNNVAEDSPTQQDRHEGFQNACAEFDVEAVLYLIHTEAMLFESIDDLLRRKIGALYLGNGMFVIRVHAVFQRLGVKVPDDVSLVAYDDSNLSKELPVPFTTVRQPLDLMARKAVEILPKVIDGTCEERLFMFANELTIRNSVRKATP